MPKKTSASQIEDRPPVIVVMGHIDHGKSTLLDHIRKTNVVDKEAGGITQHVNAYEVEHEHNGQTKRITFIDTPGHEAFSAMRSRGATVGDIAILVVAADDGVNAQTLEALGAIKIAGIPYVVAINKIDKPGADINRAITSLIENEVYLEGYGGDIPYTAISAKTGQNVPDLLDTILLVAELEELKADRSIPASGFILESSVDPKAGIAATLIIKEGTLSSGQAVVAGKATAPVRVLRDFQGRQIKEATFSSPVQLVGFDHLPPVGSIFRAYSNKKEALNAVAENQASEEVESPESVTAEVIIPLIVKANTAGTVDAVRYELAKLPSERARFKVIETGIGTVTDNDVKLAGSQKNGVIVGFQVDIDPSAKEWAERQNVTLASFKIIYELIEWLQNELQKRTPKHTVQKIVGKAKVLKTFNSSKNKQILGGRVTEGQIGIKNRVNIVRRGEIIGQGTIYGLQQSRVETQKVDTDQEFGCSLEGAKIEIAPGDILESFEEVEE